MTTDTTEPTRPPASASDGGDHVRGVIAAATVDLLAGRVDEATAALRAAGGQP